MKRPFALPLTCEYGLGKSGLRGARLLCDQSLREIAVCDTSEDCAALAGVVNAHPGLVAALKEARAAIIFRTEHCSGDVGGNCACTCDWCSDDDEIVARVDNALAAAGETP